METEKQLISHLYQNKENGKWIIQTNDEHQRGVAEMATSFSGLFGLPSWGHTLGMLHDKGKERDAFQQYIRTTSGLPVTDEKSYGEHHHAFVGWNIGNEPYGEECIQSSCQPDNLSSYRPT